MRMLAWPGSFFPAGAFFRPSVSQILRKNVQNNTSRRDPSRVLTNRSKCDCAETLSVGFAAPGKLLRPREPTEASRFQA